MSDVDPSRPAPATETNQVPALEITFSGALVGLSALITNETGRQAAGILAPLVGYGLAKLVRLFAENWASEWQADSTLWRARRYLQELEKRAGQCAPNSPERRQAEQHILELRASIQQQRLRRLGVLAPNESMPPAIRE